MESINFIQFLLACLGMTQIVVYGKIFEPIRSKFKDSYLLKCAMCSSFHLGWLLNIAFYLLDKQIMPLNLIGFVVAGCISSAFSYFGTSLINDFGLKINLTNRKD